MDRLTIGETLEGFGFYGTPIYDRPILLKLERPVQKTMTCPCCGKRVETTWRYFCPNCREDITPKTKKAKIQTLNDKLSKINVEIANLELKRRKKKFKTRWAVKVEVHC